MPAAKRLYKVTLGDDVFIVKASTQQRAVSVVHKLHVKVEVLSAIDAVDLVGTGVKVLEHGEDDAPAESEPQE